MCLLTRAFPLSQDPTPFLVRKAFVPLVASNDGNEIGNYVILKLGNLAMIVFSIHFPYHEHPLVTFDEALDMLQDMLQTAKKRVIQLGFKWKNNLVRVGGDFNTDLRGHKDKHHRSEPLIDLFSENGVSICLPRDPDLVSHRHWANPWETLSLCDWVLFSTNFQQATKHPVHQTTFEVDPLLEELVHSNHSGIASGLDLGSLL